MSTPTRQLQNLDIGGAMPTTRAQAQRDRQLSQMRARERQIQSREGSTDRQTSQVGSPSASALLGRSGSPYEISQLSPESLSRAVAGIKADHVVNHGRYFAFQLQKPDSVRIPHPSLSDNRVNCTCEIFQQNKTVCLHIYWLLEGLKTALGDRTRGALSNPPGESTMTLLSELYYRIGENLRYLPGQLNRSHEEESETESEYSTAERSPAPNDLNARKEIVRDMLSVFDARALPREYGRDFFDAAPSVETSSGHLFVPENLAATIFNLAMHDEIFYRHLRRELNRDFCATKFFQKLARGARVAIERLDNILRTESTGIEQSRQAIGDCAGFLREIVHQIRQNLDSRAPLGSKMVPKVSELLVGILDTVCQDHNLYMELIGAPPRLGPSPAWMSDNFVIDVLFDRPPNEWEHLVENLHTILERLLQYEAPVNYVRKLEGRMREYDDDIHDDED